MPKWKKGHTTPHVCVSINNPKRNIPSECSGMESKTILEFEWNERQFQNQEWDGFKDHFGTGME